MRDGKEQVAASTELEVESRVVHWEGKPSKAQKQGQARQRNWSPLDRPMTETQSFDITHGY